MPISQVESITKQQIRPERITRPFQLLAAWLTGLVAIDGAFLTAAKYLSEPTWVPGLLVAAAVVNVPLFLVAIFILQTRFRPEMQEDAYYSKYLEDKHNRVESAASELEEEVDRAISLADIRVELTGSYLDKVTSKLDLDESEKTRFQRALKEAFHAKEDLASQSLNRQMIEGFQTAFLSPDSRQDSYPKAEETFLQRVAELRYERFLEAHSTVIEQDLSVIDMSSSIERVCQILLKRAKREGKNIVVSYDQKPLRALATRAIIETTLAEIITNAIVYSPQNTTISVNGSTSGENQVIIKIENPMRGQAKVDADTSKLFEPGYRGESSREIFSAGAGMGLHLVKQSLELVGGSIEIKAVADQFTACVYLKSARHAGTHSDEIEK